MSPSNPQRQFAKPTRRCRSMGGVCASSRRRPGQLWRDVGWGMGFGGGNKTRPVQRTGRVLLRGAGRNRTDGGGFAVHCLTTWRRRLSRANTRRTGQSRHDRASAVATSPTSNSTSTVDIICCNNNCCTMTAPHTLPASEPHGPSGRASYVLQRASALFERAVARALEPHNLTTGPVRASLLVIRRTRPKAARAAAKLGKHLARWTRLRMLPRMLDRLDSAGLVAREARREKTVVWCIRR